MAESSEDHIEMVYGRQCSEAYYTQPEGALSLCKESEACYSFSFPKQEQDHISVSGMCYCQLDLLIILHAIHYHSDISFVSW